MRQWHWYSVRSYTYVRTYVDTRVVVQCKILCAALGAAARATGDGGGLMISMAGQATSKVGYICVSDVMTFLHSDWVVL